MLPQTVLTLLYSLYNRPARACAMIDTDVHFTE